MIIYTLMRDFGLGENDILGSFDNLEAAIKMAHDKVSERYIHTAFIVVHKLGDYIDMGEADNVETKNDITIYFMT